MQYDFLSVVHTLCMHVSNITEFHSSMYCNTPCYSSYVLLAYFEAELTVLYVRRTACGILQQTSLEDTQCICPAICIVLPVYHCTVHFVAGTTNEFTRNRLHVLKQGSETHM